MQRYLKTRAGMPMLDMMDLNSIPMTTFPQHGGGFARFANAGARRLEATEATA